MSSQEEDASDGAESDGNPAAPEEAQASFKGQPALTLTPAAFAKPTLTPLATLTLAPRAVTAVDTDAPGARSSASERDSGAESTLPRPRPPPPELRRNKDPAERVRLKRADGREVLVDFSRIRLGSLAGTMQSPRSLQDVARFDRLVKKAILEEEEHLRAPEVTISHVDEETERPPEVSISHVDEETEQGSSFPEGDDQDDLSRPSSERSKGQASFILPRKKNANLMADLFSMKPNRFSESRPQAGAFGDGLSNATQKRMSRMSDMKRLVFEKEEALKTSQEKAKEETLKALDEAMKAKEEQERQEKENAQMEIPKRGAPRFGTLAFLERGASPDPHPFDEDDLPIESRPEAVLVRRAAKMVHGEAAVQKSKSLWQALEGSVRKKHAAPTLPASKESQMDSVMIRSIYSTARKQIAKESNERAKSIEVQNNIDMSDDKEKDEIDAASSKPKKTNLLSVWSRGDNEVLDPKSLLKRAISSVCGSVQVVMKQKRVTEVLKSLSSVPEKEAYNVDSEWKSIMGDYKIRQTLLPGSGADKALVQTVGMNTVPEEDEESIDSFAEQAASLQTELERVVEEDEGDELVESFTDAAVSLSSMKAEISILKQKARKQLRAGEEDGSIKSKKRKNNLGNVKVGRSATISATKNVANSKKSNVSDFIGITGPARPKNMQKAPQAGAEKPSKEDNRSHSKIRQTLVATADKKAWLKLSQRFNDAVSDSLTSAEFQALIRKVSLVPSKFIQDNELETLFQNLDSGKKGVISYENDVLPWLLGEDHEEHIRAALLELETELEEASASEDGAPERPATCSIPRQSHALDHLEADDDERPKTPELHAKPRKTVISSASCDLLNIIRKSLFRPAHPRPSLKQSTLPAWLRRGDSHLLKTRTRKAVRFSRNDAMTVQNAVDWHMRNLYPLDEMSSEYEKDPEVLSPESGDSLEEALDFWAPSDGEKDLPLFPVISAEGVGDFRRVPASWWVNLFNQHYLSRERQIDKASVATSYRRSEIINGLSEAARFSIASHPEVAAGLEAAAATLGKEERAASASEARGDEVRRLTIEIRRLTKQMKEELAKGSAQSEDKVNELLQAIRRAQANIDEYRKNATGDDLLKISGMQVKEQKEIKRKKQKEYLFWLEHRYIKCFGDPRSPKNKEMGHKPFTYQGNKGVIIPAAPEKTQTKEEKDDNDDPQPAGFGGLGCRRLDSLRQEVQEADGVLELPSEDLDVDVLEYEYSDDEDTPEDEVQNHREDDEAGNENFEEDEGDEDFEEDAEDHILGDLDDDYEEDSDLDDGELDFTTQESIKDLERRIALCEGHIKQFVDKFHDKFNAAARKSMFVAKDLGAKGWKRKSVFQDERQNMYLEQAICDVALSLVAASPQRKWGEKFRFRARVLTTALRLKRAAAAMSLTGREADPAPLETEKASPEFQSKVEDSAVALQDEESAAKAVYSMLSSFVVTHQKAPSLSWKIEAEVGKQQQDDVRVVHQVAASPRNQMFVEPLHSSKTSTMPLRVSAHTPLPVPKQDSTGETVETVMKLRTNRFSRILSSPVRADSPSLVTEASSSPRSPSAVLPAPPTTTPWKATRPFNCELRWHRQRETVVEDHRSIIDVLPSDFSLPPSPTPLPPIGASECNVFFRRRRHQMVIVPDDPPLPKSRRKKLFLGATRSHDCV